MGIEAFAEAAAALVPGFRVAAVEDVDFLAPFKFYRDEPRTVRARGGPPARRATPSWPSAASSGAARFPGRPSRRRRSTSAPASGSSGATRRAETFAAVLENRAATALARVRHLPVYFHGPAYQVLESAWKNGSGVVGLFADPLPPNHVPPTRPTLMAPRLVELCFQTAGVFELGTRGRMGLPLRVERVRAVRPPETANGARSSPSSRPSASGDGSFDARVVDADGNVYLAVDGYRTVELPGAASAAQLEPFRAAMA